VVRARAVGRAIHPPSIVMRMKTVSALMSVIACARRRAAEYVHALICDGGPSPLALRSTLRGSAGRCARDTGGGRALTKIFLFRISSPPTEILMQLGSHRVEIGIALLPRPGGGGGEDGGQREQPRQAHRGLCVEFSAGRWELGAAALALGRGERSGD
jgi:hypothetical protein